MSAVTAKGQTPASNSPSDIASAINNISTGDYTQADLAPIATAITNKGVTTSSSATPSTMATNINNISTDSIIAIEQSDRNGSGNIIAAQGIYFYYSSVYAWVFEKPSPQYPKGVISTNFGQLTTNGSSVVSTQSISNRASWFYLYMKYFSSESNNRQNKPYVKFFGTYNGLQSTDTVLIRGSGTDTSGNPFGGSRTIKCSTLMNNSGSSNSPLWIGSGTSNSYTIYKSEYPISSGAYYNTPIYFEVYIYRE